MSNLLNHSLIKTLHRDSTVTLDDLIKQNLFIEPPAEPCHHIDPGAWSLWYREELPENDRTRLRSAVRENPRLIRAAALVVANATGKLSKQQQRMAFDYARYFEAHEYELEQLARRSEGGRITAQQKKDDAAANMAEAVRLWDELGSSGKAEHERASIIAQRMGAKPNTVRGWLKKAGLR